MRSHPPTLLKLVERTLREECGVAPGAGILVAVSGGPDSMALLHALSLLDAMRLRLVAVGVDHGLRAEGQLEVQRARAFAQQRGVPFEIRSLQLAAGGNLQARAREARYQVLEQVQKEHQLEHLATAHHADDRAETLMMRLLSGASPGGLAVLPARDQARIRPMIRARKADVLAHVQRHQIPFSSDPSNHDPRFLRSQVRAELMPLLQKLSPKAVEHLNALAEELAQRAHEGEPEPEILDDSGQPLPLSRAQREQLRRALRYQQRDTRVLLSGNRAIVLDPESGRPRLETSKNRPKSPAIRHTDQSSSNASSGGAKKLKSG